MREAGLAGSRACCVRRGRGLHLFFQSWSLPIAGVTSWLTSPAYEGHFPPCSGVRVPLALEAGDGSIRGSVELAQKGPNGKATKGSDRLKGSSAGSAQIGASAQRATRSLILQPEAGEGRQFPIMFQTDSGPRPPQKSSLAMPHVLSPGKQVCFFLAGLKASFPSSVVCLARPASTFCHLTRTPSQDKLGHNP